MIAKTTIQSFLLGSLLLSMVSCQDPEVQYPYTGPPKEIISLERAQEMYDTYSKRRVPIIEEFEDSIDSKTAKFEAARFIEYDYETLKHYIAFIEKESKNANVEISSLRFYLTNYPDNSTFSNGDPVKYPRRTSVMMVPTTQLEGEKVGFYIEQTDDVSRAVPIYKYRRGVIKERVEQEKEKQGSINEAGFFTANTTVVQQPISLILNDGHVGPPPPLKDFEGN